MRLWPPIFYDWGSTAAERSQTMPCDALIEHADEALHRAVDVAAPAGILFRWLCQLRGDPYSYDLLDNRGRRSPRELTPGLERLEVGQPVMRVFRLVAFEPGRSITLFCEGRLVQAVACTYSVRLVSAQRSRLLVKTAIVHRPGAGGLPARLLLAPGDLLMMRRQLLNLGALAEAQAAEEARTLA